MKRYALLPHVYYCFTGGVGVFLDLRQDKYVGVDAATADIVHDYVDGVNVYGQVKGDAPAPAAKAVLAELEQSGVISTTSKPQRNQTVPPSAPRKALLEESVEFETKIRLKHIVIFLVSLIHTLALLRLTSLDRVIGSVATRKRVRGAKNTAFDVGSCRELVHIFVRLRTYVYTAHNQCLLDSLLLTEFLARNHLYPTLVFGVSTGPFSAHCWVQYDDTVLWGRPERTGTFTPIFAV